MTSPNFEFEFDRDLSTNNFQQDISTTGGSLSSQNFDFDSGLAPRIIEEDGADSGGGGGGSCPADGTLIRCTSNGVGLFHTGPDANGICTQGFLQTDICRISSPTPTPTPPPTAACEPVGTFLGCTGTEDIGVFSLGPQADGGCLNEERRTTSCKSTTTITNTGLCQADAECSAGYRCDFSTTTQIGDDPTNQAGKCVKVETYCNYKDVTAACSDTVAGPGLVGYQGFAIKTIPVTDVNGNPLPLGCKLNPDINTNWDLGECIEPTPLCSYIEEEASCTQILGDGYSGIASRRVLSSNNPANCRQDPNIGSASDWNTAGCGRIGDPPLCVTKTETNSCRNLLGNNYSSQQVLSRTVLDRDSTGAVQPAGCVIAGITDYNTSECVRITTPPPTALTPPPTALTPPPIGLTPPPVAITPPPVELTPPPIAITPPPVGFTPPPITPPPVVQLTWRDCVTGVVNIGTPPANFIQVGYNGPVGGTCWEAPTEIGFNPSLSEALRFTYQRGSSVYPTPKSIVATNSAYGTSYRLTIRTNPDVKLIHNSAQGDGNLSFILSPRSSATFYVNVTPKLISMLQDGSTSLYMDVEYQPVL